MMKLIQTILIVLVLTATGLFAVKMITGTNEPEVDETANDAALKSSTSGELGAQPATTAEQPPAIESDSAGATAENSGYQPNTPTQTTPQTSIQTDDAAPSMAVEPASSAEQAPTRDTPVIEVPQSYSVERAAEFFIPADQRSPGNLGGPPPPPAAVMQGLSAPPPPAAPSAPSLKPPVAPGS